MKYYTEKFPLWDMQFVCAVVYRKIEEDAAEAFGSSLNDSAYNILVDG